MRLCMFSDGPAGAGRLGVVLADGRILDAPAAGRRLSIGAEAAASIASIRACAGSGDRGLGMLGKLVAWADGNPDAQPLIYDEADIAFHPPVADPSKFICVGKNSKRHLEELVRTQLIKELPNEPTGFAKLPFTLTGHRSQVARPPGIVQFDYEPEMAFVIGKPGVAISRERSIEHVFGITVLNDLTARELQRAEIISGTRFGVSKNLPGFGPMGPYVVTMDEIGDFRNLYLACHVNGELRNRFSTADLIYNIPDTIEHFSRHIPLESGDLFSTGAAGGVAVAQHNAAELFLKPGDVVDAAIEGLMSLRIHIV